MRFWIAYCNNSALERRSAVNRLVAYAVAILAVTIPAALLARTLIETDEDSLERLVSGIEQDRADALLSRAAFDNGGVVISTGSTSRRFGTAGHDEARALLEAATGLESAENIQLRQHQVTINEGRATAVLNVEVDSSSYVALRVNLTRHGEEWLVDHIRIMG